MATSQDFVDFVCDQIGTAWYPRWKKMFGEYMVYVNDKPLFLVCDKTVYVKKLESLKSLLSEENTGFPYPGAKEHFTLDMEDRELVQTVTALLEKEIPVPVKKKRS